LSSLSGRLISPQQLTVTLETHSSSTKNNTNLKSEQVKNTSDSITVNWYLYADLYCLDYDGNVFDCALIALLAALHNGLLSILHYFNILFFS
jgi:exosome complex RNA-binding protein Rrp42 (RNase PH superfamily)